ncbi:MAG: cysteine desulfurase family protein [Acidobacteriota bacterium]
MDAPRPSARRLYCDANATTPLHPAVQECLAEAHARLFGNPASLHGTGRMAREALEEARGRVAGLVGCLPEEVVFVASGTEGNHGALLSAALAGPERRRILVSAVEHPSVFGAAEILKERGFAVEEIPVDGAGLLDLEALEGRMGDDVALVSVLSAHNETGVLQPVESVGTLCRRYGALFHTDAVQAAGKVPLRWREALPDYLVVAAHKFYGPKGVAALVARRGAPVAPLLRGGGQEAGRRASTVAVPLAVAMGRAAGVALAEMGAWKAVEELRDALEERLGARFGARVFGREAPRLPNTSFFSLPGICAARMVAELDRRGIDVSTASACHSGEGGLPRVLKAMGVPEEAAGTVLRVSLLRTTTAEEAAFLTRNAEEAAEILREEP